MHFRQVALVVLASLGLSAAPPTVATQPPGGCFVDTSQADFEAGVQTGCDLTTMPGKLTLPTTTAVNQQNLSVTADAFPFDATSWTGQTFSTTSGGAIYRIDLNLACVGCTGTTPDLVVSIRSTSGGVPTGPDIATSTIAGFSSGSSALRAAEFSTPGRISSFVQYAVIVRPAANPSVGTYAYVCSCGSADSNPYANGARVTSANSGVAWAADTTVGGRDLGFQVHLTTAAFGLHGVFVSSLKDANPPDGQVAVWSTINFGWAEYPQITVKVAASDSPTGPFTFVGPQNGFRSGDSLAQFNGKRYLKYQVDLFSGGGIAPALDEVSICFSFSSPPVITLHPVSQVIGLHSPPVTLTAAASGSPAPTYQWYAQPFSLPISGATASSYSPPSSGGSYFVRATNSSGSADSNVAVITAVPYDLFTDNTLTADVTPVKAIHITELRARIEQQRTRFGLSPFPWTDSSMSAGSTTPRPVHITELRTALMEAYVIPGMTPVSFTDPGLSSGMPIKRVHIQELRDAVVALERR